VHWTGWHGICASGSTPISVQLHGGSVESLTTEERVAAYDVEARLWHARYGRPFWVAETSNLGLSVDAEQIL